jgi:hypothetical protein
MLSAIRQDAEENFRKNSQYAEFRQFVFVYLIHGQLSAMRALPY